MRNGQLLQLRMVPIETPMPLSRRCMMASWRRNLFGGSKLLRALALGHLIQGCESFALWLVAVALKAGPSLELHLKSWNSCLCACMMVAVVRLLITGPEVHTKVGAHVSAQSSAAARGHAIIMTCGHC
jgi:hypothetical protein